MLRFVAAVLLGSLASMTVACSSPVPETDQPEAQAEAEDTAIDMPASAESTTVLGVTAWRVTMNDGTYAVAGFDNAYELKIGMQTNTRDGAEGELRTEVIVDGPDFHLAKRFVTKAGQTTFAQDDISGNAVASKALELMRSDVTGGSAASQLETSALRPLDETALVQPGTGNGFEYYDRPECKAGSFCANIVSQTNTDCHSSAWCSKYASCGGSDEQCKADQAYVKNTGCDKKCAKKACPSSGRGDQLVCGRASLVCNKKQCDAAMEATCKKYGALCANTQTAVGERGPNDGYGQ